MTEAAALSKRTIITELVRSTHANLTEYLPTGRQAAAEDPEFFAHLVAWDASKGQVKDAHVALPVVALGATALGGVAADPALVENALAHIAALGPREFAQAFAFIKTAGASRKQRDARLKLRYLRDIEARRGNDRFLLQHAHTLKQLYAPPFRVKPDDRIRPFLRRSRHAASGLLARLRALPTAPADQLTELVGGMPFLMVRGAIDQRLRTNPEALAAVIRGMSQGELTTSAKLLERLGMNEHEVTQAAFRETLAARAGQATKHGGMLKAGHKAKEVRDEATRAVLESAQERALDAQMETIAGRWAVLGDISPSMKQFVDQMREVASLMARKCQHVTFILFDSNPRAFDVTGLSLDEIRAATSRMSGGGGTAIGACLDYLRDRKIAVDGIALVSDGEENGAVSFATAYTRYAAALGVDPSVYLYLLRGSGEPMLGSCRAAEIDVQVHDLRSLPTDRYGLPNLVLTMRTGRFALVDEIYATPLRTLDQVLPRTTDIRVLAPVPETLLVTE